MARLTSQRLYLTQGWKLTSSRRRGLINDSVRSVEGKRSNNKHTHTPQLVPTSHTLCLFLHSDNSMTTLTNLASLTICCWPQSEEQKRTHSLLCSHSNCYSDCVQVHTHIIKERCGLLCPESLQQ